MNEVKARAMKLIEDAPDEIAAEVIDFIEYLKFKRDNFNDLVDASESSISFWLNDEDEAWNDV